jgi:class 3 adenylate cyclase
MSLAQRKRLARALSGVESLRLTNPRSAHDQVLQQWWGRSQRLLSSPEQTARNLEFASLVDMESTVPTIRVPTLVFHRRDNKLSDIERTRRFVSLVPSARLVELPGSDSDIYLGDTTQVLAEVQAFVCEARDDEAARRAAERPLATVLFTDIVSSTDKLATAGDAAWMKVLDDHDKAVNAIVEAHRGHVVKTLGDGVLATFEFPGRAILCAAAIQSQLADRGVRLRAGLHTGEIELRDSGDVAGIAVHIASRIAGLANADEILVSRTVAPRLSRAEGSARLRQ